MSRVVVFLQAFLALCLLREIFKHQCDQKLFNKRPKRSFQNQPILSLTQENNDYLLLKTLLYIFKTLKVVKI
jgi:hypothetical protein